MKDNTVTTNDGREFELTADELKVMSDKFSINNETGLAIKSMAEEFVVFWMAKQNVQKTKEEWLKSLSVSVSLALDKEKGASNER